MNCIPFSVIKAVGGLLLFTNNANRTLFATHYHQLIGLENQLDGLMNIHVQVAELGDELRFLHTVADGPCDDSYGVHVAALAGLPSEVVERAADLLQFLESQAQGAKAGKSGQPDRRELGQRSLYGWRLPIGGIAEQAIESDLETNQTSIPEVEVNALQELKSVDPDMLSPREALDALYRLRNILQGRHELMRE